MLRLEVRESHAVFGQLIHAWSSVRLRSVTPQVSVPLIIRKDDQDIWSLAIALGK